MTELPHHPVSQILPPMSAAEYESFKADVKVKGLLEDIWTYQGQIIDGRNRDRACRETGVEPRYREWDGTGSLADFVVSLNLHRRHLNESQRALVADRLKSYYEDEARQRMVAGKRAGGTDPSAHVREGRGTLNTVDGHPARKGKSAEEAARRLNVSTRNVESAGRLRRRGTAKLIKAVEDGRVSIRAATDVADLPPERQEEVVDAGHDEIVKTALEIRELKQKKRRLEGEASASLPTSPAGPSPAERWHKLMHDLQALASGIEELGGIERVAANWTATMRGQYAKRVRGFITTLEAFAAGLEK